MLEEEEIMTVWEDEDTGEVHWHKTEYQDLIRKIIDMETDIFRLKQQIAKCKCGDNGR